MPPGDTPTALQKFQSTKCFRASSAPYFNFSHANTYTTATMKNAAVHAKKIKSRIESLPLVFH
jgi:hypothetical protein